VPGYGLDENSELLGDFQGTLDNGGDKVALIGADGQGVDSMSYDDDAPWPAGADALGAQEEWLADELLPLEQHRYRGISLERVSFDVPSGELANWAPSPVDGATPGKPNASARERPLPVVAETARRSRRQRRPAHPRGRRGPRTGAFHSLPCPPEASGSSRSSTPS
jgi:hypothetical protein